MYFLRFSGIRNEDVAYDCGKEIGSQEELMQRL